VSKRRFRDSEEKKSPEEVSPEERRAIRKRDRAKESKGRRLKPPRAGWRRAVVPGVVVGAVAVVIAILVLGAGTWFQTPCLALTPIPVQSGLPAFPPSNTTDFSTTWCPTATAIVVAHPLLRVVVGSGTVVLPPSIGRSTNFTGRECDLPVYTRPDVSGYPNGMIYIASPWAYQYTLGDFFEIWQDSYLSAHVNATYNSRTIDYTATELLGLKADATHTITLFVDNQVNHDGPNLTLNTLDNLGGTIPSCLQSKYGTGHVISLVFKSGTAGAATGVPKLPTHDTTPVTNPPTFESPMPRVVPSLFSPPAPIGPGPGLLWTLRPAA